MSHTGQLAADEAAHAAALASETFPVVRRTQTVIVSKLPAASTCKGARAIVTDATATTFASTVVGGGSTLVPVYSDGTNWKIG